MSLAGLGGGAAALGEKLQHATGSMKAVLGGIGAHGAEIHRTFALLFVFAATSWAIYRSTSAPRGLLRRTSAGYVARIDAQQRSMFMPPSGAKLAWMQLGIVVAVLSIYGVMPNVGLLFVALGVAVLPPVMISRKVAARRETIDEQANGFALALGNALKATSSIGDALKGAVDVTAKPLKDELDTALRQMRVGSTLEEALLALSARVQSTALDVVVSALLIGRQTGGDLPRILEGTAASLRELKRLEKHTDKVTRSAKQSLLIAAALSLGIAVMLPTLFPGFLDPLRTTVKGQIYTVQMALVYLFALYLGYRITRKSI